MIKKKIVLIGCVLSSKIALDFLLSLNKNQYELSGVITKHESSINADFVDISLISKKNKIPTFIFKVNDKVGDMSSWLESIKPDLMFVIGWSHILSSEIISIPSIGTIGFHPTDLPINRGRHPIIWSLVLGLRKTASSFFLLEAEVDKGSIINKRVIKIAINDNAKTLYSKICRSIPIQINQILGSIKNNSFSHIAQPQDNRLSNSWRKRKAIDGKIDWRMSSVSIYNLIRALSWPYSGAFFEDNSGKEVKVFDSKIYKGTISNNFEPGKVLSAKKNSLLVKTSDGAILLKDISPKAIHIKGDYL